MKKSLQVIPILAFTFLLTSCHRQFVASNFDQQTSKHKLVAIVPAEMVFTGKQPRNISFEEIEKIEESESKAFQVSLYNNVLRYANTHKRRIRVNVQDLSTTQRLMEEKGISVRDSWKQNDEELARILGVDAIVRMRIQKQRYMSDLASYGVHAAHKVINDANLGISIPVGLEKSNDIYASCNLIVDNKSIWNDTYKRSANWSSPANYIIEKITKKFGKHFPYREKK